MQKLWMQSQDVVPSACNPTPWEAEAELQLRGNSVLNKQAAEGAA